ncbi:hypothetical protein D3C75_604420 [compost metagenome]
MIAQQPADNRNQGFRNPGVQLGFHSRLPAAVQPAGNHIQHKRPQAVQIRGRSALPAAVLLGSCEAGGAQLLRILPGSLSVAARDTEVNQHQPACSGQHDISRLQIAVDNRRMLPVQIRKHFQQLKGISNDSSRIQRISICLYRLRQCHPLNIIHNHIPISFFIWRKKVGNSRKQAVVQGDQQLCLRLHSSKCLLMANAFLHRPPLPWQPHILSQIDMAHPAGADPFHNPVPLTN